MKKVRPVSWQITSKTAFAAVCAFTLATGPAAAAELPQATKDTLKRLKLKTSILKGLDEELKLPAGWAAKAKKEGKLTILSSWDQRQFTAMTRAFKARYPYITVRYSRASYNQRVLKTLIAFKEGRVLTDILTGFGGGYRLFKEVGALENLTDIPNFKRSLPKNMRDPAGFWLGQRLRYWCIAYNTAKVSKDMLPKRWEDLITDTRWHGGKLGIANRPQLWLLMLWGAKGPKWTTDYATRFLDRVKPQMRKEGTNALISLAVAGEFYAALPAAAYRTRQYQAKGAPIAWHCPEPVPLAVSEMGIVKGAPNVHAAKVFANWFLSKEGQIAQFAANNAPPVHKDLQTKEFLVYPDQVLGRKIAYREPKLEAEYKKLVAVWDPIWRKASGEKIQKIETFKVSLDGVKRGGRVLTFKRGGKDQRIRVSGRRTKVYIGGKLEGRAKLKPGMACEITAPEKGREAKKVAC
jgi:iron(III) transport system substrate-binding protein